MNTAVPIRPREADAGVAPEPFCKVYTAADILAQLRITEVWRMLGGGELRHGRGKRFWCGGDSPEAVSLSDAKNTFFDFVAGQGGGLLDLVVRVRGGNRADALRWCADLAGVPMEDRPLSPAERERWARDRRELERDLPAARLWRRGAVLLAEETLGELKSALVDPIAPQPDPGEICRLTLQVARWQRMDGAALVAEYLWWREHCPDLTAGMVHAARLRERAEVRTLLEYFTEAEADAA
jgi:hypothetical protein